MQQQIDQLRNEVSGIEHTVQTQLGSLSASLEEQMTEQNSLVADSSVEVLSVDPDAETVVLRITALPKAAFENTTTLFTVRMEGEAPVSFSAQRMTDGSFVGESTLPLVSAYTLSVSFEQNGETQSQLLPNILGDLRANYLLTIYSMGFRGQVGFDGENSLCTLSGTAEVSYNLAYQEDIMVSRAVRGRMELWADGACQQSYPLLGMDDFDPYAAYSECTLFVEIDEVFPLQDSSIVHLRAVLEDN